MEMRGGEEKREEKSNRNLCESYQLLTAPAWEHPHTHTHTFTMETIQAFILGLSHINAPLETTGQFPTEQWVRPMAVLGIIVVADVPQLLPVAQELAQVCCGLG